MIWLGWVYGISTIVGYLMPNPFYTCILNIYIAQSAGALEYNVSHPTPGFDIKQSDGEAPVMLELWGMRSTPSLPSLPGLLLPGVVAPDRALLMGQIELKSVLMLNWITWNRTVLTCNLRTHAKLNCLKENCFDI